MWCSDRAGACMWFYGGVGHMRGAMANGSMCVMLWMGRGICVLQLTGRGIYFL